jgi:hypothetical protein
MSKPVRRILTGHNEQGKSVIIEDQASPNDMKVKGIPGFIWHEIWAVDGAPALTSGNADAADRPVNLQPPDMGNVFRIIDMPPDTVRFGAGVDKASTTSQYGGSDAYAAGASSRHPGFHKTRTLDYAIVLEGEVFAMMDVGETKMGPGDVLIQRGTNHAWSNRSNASCRIAFILIDAEELPK